MNDFEGRVAVVTGGSSGIGRAVVARLAGAGASVVFCTHDAVSLHAVETQFDGARFDGGSPAVTGMTADVRSAAEMRRLMATAVERYGGLDVLVCSAGVQTYGTAEDTSEDDWHAVLDTNLTGVFLAAKFAIPLLRERGGGSIVNISSVQGLTPKGRVLGYSVSKAGVDALTRSMAVDHAADGIRVNSVAPGPVDTPLLKVTDHTRPHQPTRREARLASPAVPTDVPRRRLARPEEIAEVVAFLAGPASSYVTGATYLADGGISASQAGVLAMASPRRYDDD